LSVFVKVAAGAPEKFPAAMSVARLITVVVVAETNCFVA
jgi:hypothetical protein